MLTTSEKMIVSGRYLYERKRLEASRRGIQLILKQGKAFGRPRGSKVAVGSPAWDEKYRAIADCLHAGASIAEAAKKTGKSISTIKRVKKMLILE